MKVENLARIYAVVCGSLLVANLNINDDENSLCLTALFVEIFQAEVARLITCKQQHHSVKKYNYRIRIQIVIAECECYH